jgi:hypothetical protein
MKLKPLKKKLVKQEPVKQAELKDLFPKIVNRYSLATRLLALAHWQEYNGHDCFATACDTALVKGKLATFVDKPHPVSPEKLQSLKYVRLTKAGIALAESFNKSLLKITNGTNTKLS